LNFENIYGELGRNFIEAHHLVPISRLGAIKIHLNVKNDFAVLCSNCHSMIHKLSDPSDVKLLREIIRINKKVV
jgi:5-methylcytosine-specific restriction protein A